MPMPTLPSFNIVNLASVDATKLVPSDLVPK